MKSVPRGILTAVLAASCALVTVSSVFVGIETRRIKLVTEPHTPSSDRIAVTVTDPAADGLVAPWAIIARIRQDGTEPASFRLFVDGQLACERRLPAGRTARLDCAAAGGWSRPTAPHEILVTGPGAWALEYMEIATHHGNTTGPLTSFIVPAGATAFTRPSAVWALVAFAAVAMLGLRRPSADRPRWARLASGVVHAGGAALLLVVAVAPWVSPYRVLVSAGTIAGWITAIAIARWWPSALLLRPWATAPRAAFLLALAMFVLSSLLGTRALGGADSYGYISQADLWLQGDLKIAQTFATRAPWPDADRAFAPLGYEPSRVDNRVIVPTYAPGLPLLFALAKGIGGQTAMYLVVPLSAAVLVFATFVLGRRLGSDAAGLIGACLVATSPIVLSFALQAMTDVPVAAAWTAAFCAALGPRRVRSAVWAGAFAGLAVLIRPNLAPLAGILGLHYALQLWTRAERRRALTLCVAYALSVVPGIVVVALVNRWLYGSPLTSGYGPADKLFALNRMPVNAGHYVTWLVQSQTPAVLVGVTAIFAPTRFVWPKVADRRVFIVMGAFVAALWATYCAWLVFDTWWFLRFMIASWPFFMVGIGATAIALTRLPGRHARPAVVCALIALVLLQLWYADRQDVLRSGRHEDRNVAVGRLVRELTPPHSVIISGIHSGSLRYYAGRMTIYLPWLDALSLDRAVDWLAERGVRTYALVEEWEMAEFRGRFASQRRMAVVDEPPVATYREGTTTFLFDLSGRQNSTAAPVIASGAPRLWLAPPPVPLPPLPLDN